jgi:hypothetical protein
LNKISGLILLIMRLHWAPLILIFTSARIGNVDWEKTMRQHIGHEKDITQQKTKRKSMCKNMPYWKHKNTPIKNWPWSAPLVCACEDAYAWMQDMQCT